MVGDSRAQQGCRPLLLRCENRFKAGQGQSAPAKPGPRAEGSLAPLGTEIEALTARGRAILRVPLKPAGPAGLRERPPPSTGRAGGVAVWGCALGLWAVPNSLASVRGVVGRLSTRRGHSETLRNRGVQWTLVMTPTAKKKKKQIKG